MARAKWRTVSCTDDGIRQHTSQQRAYAYIAGQEPGLRFRVQVDEGHGWGPYATVVSNGNGTTDVEIR